MKSIQKILGLGVLCCFVSTCAHADLLGFAPSFPQISYDSSDPNSISYNPGTQVFTVNSLPVAISFSAVESSDLIVSNRNIQIQLNTDGTLLSGANGFTVTGQFTRVVGGVTNTYSGVLLQGDVVGFGYSDSQFTDNYDFRIHVTGGALQSFFSTGDNGDIIAQVASESSTFNGDFTEEFHGTVKGVCGPIDTTPPDVTCPPLSQVVTTPATNNGVSGFIITYPDPIVTDNTDPAPFVFADTPSGTFVALNPGDTLTITVFAFDAAGNLNFCSFDVTMNPNGGGGNGNCSLAFNDSGCSLTTLTNDPGKCSATYTFTAPAATNCSGSFAASPTAIDQSGMVITLTNLGGGVYQGVFPHTTTGTNVITFVATDGNGNSVTRQCFVVVLDGEAPTIQCMNQTATFKPILTNALSCIDATFNNTPIAASNYIWFNSAVRIPQDGGNSVFTVHIFDQTIYLELDDTNLTVSVPESFVTFSNGVAIATTTFSSGTWMTVASPKFGGNTFASGVAWQVPFNLNSQFGKPPGHDHDDGAPKHGVKAADWCARFAVDKPGVVVQWQWAAAVYSTFSTDPNAIGVKPVDGNVANAYHNSDHAGTPENFKPYLLGGARGGGGNNYTGSYSDTKRANLGVGTVCEGAVNFKTPLAADNCDNSVTVTCDPPSGSIFGPGDHTIVTTAVDSSGNSNTCSFTLTVLSPLQVVFDSPADDNIDDNTSEPDAGFTDMNCPDDPSTPQIVTRFTVGDRICHTVRLLDCNGNDVTCQMAPFCTVHIDVTERQGSYYDSILIQDLLQSSSCCGTTGGIMVPSSCGSCSFQYILDTRNYEAQTINNGKFFRSCVWVEYNSSPGIPVGMEDVVLESK